LLLTIFADIIITFLREIFKLTAFKAVQIIMKASNNTQRN